MKLLKMSVAKFDQFRSYLETQASTRFAIGKNIVCVAFAIQNSLKTYYFDFASARLTILPLPLPSIPNYAGKKSTRITAISSIPLPGSADELSFIVLGFDNGVVLFLNEELLLQGVFIPPRHLPASPVIQIISSSESRFNTSYFLSLRYQQRVFTFQVFDILGALFPAISLSEQMDVLVHQSQLLFRDTQQIMVFPLSQYVCYELTSLDQTCLVQESVFLFEQTNLLQIAARPLVTKLVPFYNRLFGNAQVPPEIKLMAQEISYQQSGQMNVNGDGFSYVISPSLAKRPQIGAFYTGVYFVDKLNLAAGFIAGDSVKTAQNPCKNPEPASDFGLLKKKAPRGQFFAERSYKIPFALWVVENLPHLLCLTSDGALLNIRADTLDIVACSYACDAMRGKILGMVCQRRGNLLVVLQEIYADCGAAPGRLVDGFQAGPNSPEEQADCARPWHCEQPLRIQRTEFELPSLIFRGTYEESYALIVDFAYQQWLMRFVSAEEATDSTSDSVSREGDQVIVTRCGLDA